MMWFRLNSRYLTFFLSFLVSFCFFAGFISSAVVTLKSIEIFKTHEWIEDPKVYFQCKGEKRTFLPDVKTVYVTYTFKGQESWQPLLNLSDTKCKRCGVYEKDRFKPDDVFDEWEFCPSDFTTPDGKYHHQKDAEFNATFFCQDCANRLIGSNETRPAIDSSSKSKRHILVIVFVVGSVLILAIAGLVVGYRYWQKWKREKDQARFRKLFEDVDEMEDELGIIY